MPETVLTNVWEQVAPPKVATATSLGSARRHLGNEGRPGAICSCLIFLLPDEVCALFQSWNSCLNVTSSVSIFTHDDAWIHSKAHIGAVYVEENLFALVCFIPTSMGVFSCLTYAMKPCNHMIQTHQWRAGS